MKNIGNKKIHFHIIKNCCNCFKDFFAECQKSNRVFFGGGGGGNSNADSIKSVYEDPFRQKIKLLVLKSLDPYLDCYHARSGSGTFFYGSSTQIHIPINLLNLCSLFRILKAHAHSSKHISTNKMVYCAAEGCDNAYKRETSLHVHIRMVHPHLCKTKTKRAKPVKVKWSPKACCDFCIIFNLVIVSQTLQRKFIHSLELTLL